MAFAITSDGHGFILHGELDMANEREFAAAFESVLNSGAPVTVDMRQLRFIDSSGIRVIIAAPSPPRMRASSCTACTIRYRGSCT